VSSHSGGANLLTGTSSAGHRRKASKASGASPAGTSRAVANKPIVRPNPQVARGAGYEPVCLPIEDCQTTGWWQCVKARKLHTRVNRLEQLFVVKQPIHAARLLLSCHTLLLLLLLLWHELSLLWNALLLPCHVLLRL
jgi:hypothetical protein